MNQSPAFDKWADGYHFDRLERIAARQAWDAALSIVSEIAACPECGNPPDKACELKYLAARCPRRTPSSAAGPSTPSVGERAVSFHEWWDALNDDSFIVPSHAIKGHAWKAWNAALDAHAVVSSANGAHTILGIMRRMGLEGEHPLAIMRAVREYCESAESK